MKQEHLKPASPLPKIKEAPCHNCQVRSLGCHDKCALYQGYAKEVKALNNTIRSQDSYVGDNEDRQYTKVITRYYS